MSLRSIIIIMLLTCSFVKVNAQEFKLGKVSIAELEQKVHPNDSSAVAAILFKKGESSIEYFENQGFILTTQVDVRIKIYKKEGYGWANQSVIYYNGGNDSREDVDFKDMNTYNLVDGKIEKTKLKSDGIFDEEVNKFTGRKKITMPNVKEGSVIEYSYTTRTKNIQMMKEWGFQTNIPVNYSEFTTYIPEYYVFNIREKGAIFPKVSTEKNNKSILINYKERYAVGGSGAATKTEYSQDRVSYSETKTKYVAIDLPAIKEESFVNNIKNYTSSLGFELSMVSFPNSSPKTFSTNWNSVAKTIYEYDNFGPELNKTGYFEDDLKVLLAGARSPEEKILIILNHVKSNVKWNNHNSYACEKGVRKAYQEKSGNTAEINLMLTAMLRYSGLTANPVLVSTRSNGIALFPNRTAYNYVIAAVEMSTGNILLDATDKFSAPNVLPLRVLNWYGRLIRNDGSSEQVGLMPKKASSDVVFMNYNIDANGKIIGEVKKQYSDYNAMNFRRNISEQKEEDYLEKLENSNGKIEIGNYSRNNEKELLLPVSETFSFTASNFCDRIGGKIYLNPMLFFADRKSPFNQEKREYPVDFGFPFSKKYTITIKIPEGFTVESLPAPLTINMADNVGGFKFNIGESGGFLQVVIGSQINEAIISAEQYDMLKKYYKAMIEKETEKIVLKRI